MATVLAVLAWAPVQASGQRADSTPTVTYRFPDTTALPLWRVANQPEVSVGVMDGAEEYMIFLAITVARRPDGTLLVANARGTELRFYDARGRHVRTVGRDGDGPGEYRLITSIRSMPDGRLILFDDRLDRVTRLEADGTLIATERTPYVNLGQVLENGAVVGTTGDAWSPRRHGMGLTKTTTHVLTVDPTTGTTDTVASMPGIQWWAHRLSAKRSNTQPVPFAPRTEHAAGLDRLAIGWTGSPRIHVYDDRGTPIRVIRWSQEPRPVRDEDVEGLIMRRSEEYQADFRRALRDMPLPDTHPLYGSLLVDDDGRVWAHLGEQANGERRWLVFGEDDSGYVDTPARFRVHAIGDGRIVGIGYDEWGVARVQVFRLLPAPDASDGGS